MSVIPREQGESREFPDKAITSCCSGTAGGTKLCHYASLLHILDLTDALGVDSFPSWSDAADKFGDYFDDQQKTL